MSDKQFERIISCILETGDEIEYQIYEDLILETTKMSVLIKW